jgi:uncharacterized membrane protein
MWRPRMNSPLIFRASFRTGITLKGIDGLLEAIGGVLLWFINPGQLGTTLQTIFEHELLRDPHDILARHLLHTSERIAQSDPLFASIFLLCHGLMKVVLSLLLWMNKLWAYPLAIVCFSAFAVFGIFRYVHTHATLLMVIAVFDLLIVYLTWEEYGVEKRKRAQVKK